MEAYRDQYATLFNNGRNVVVIGVSADPDTLLAAWAREKDFPMLFVTDPDGAIGRAYGAFSEQSKRNSRHLFVIAPDGKVSYVVRPFNVMAEQAYKDLDAAVDKVSGAGPAPGQ
jgi:peroxiredoxin